MGILDKLFGSKKKGKINNDQEIEHAVIIEFNYGIQGMDKLYDLTDKLKKIIVNNQLGEYDGHEIATDYSDGFIYMYGSNAEALFNGIKETLEQTDFMKGAKAKLRFGPPEEGIKEITVEIGK
ncbi:hypothetical protein [Zunongwangia pacifica]|uniref:Uncharacterized protein n=1 Tax=Zunongwangia pacifica TaxID=2911062 RepID=A0A9X1ZV70_9FLAO|nr:hypothetical protein [Zunongwangia pacifica]MCL6220731.1 hypothetical protein [Zunongwangia pacifica]